MTLRIFESVFYKSLIRACSFDNSLAASQNARSYGQTINHRALRICKKRIQKVLMLSPCILINIFSYLLSDLYMTNTTYKSEFSITIHRCHNLLFSRHCQITFHILAIQDRGKSFCFNHPHQFICNCTKIFLPIHQMKFRIQ